MRKRITLALTCLLLSTKMFASHAVGAEILYAYNGSNYTVTYTYYRDCSGIGAPTSVTVNFSSSSCSMNFNRTFANTSVNTNASMYCPSAGVSCSSSSGYPMREIYTYVDTVSLPPCSDWKMSVSISALNNSLTNIVGGGNLYVEAFLNNSTAINNSPVVATHPPFVIATNTYQTSSIQAIDPDGDSLVYQMMIPQIGPGSTVSYTGGCSLTHPFSSSSICSVDAGHEYLGLYSNTMAFGLLSMRVNEYRSGTLVGYTTRTWSVVSMSFTAPKNPLAVSGTVFTHVTHPGQTQTISMSYSDSTSTDSVFVGFLTTNGWTYMPTSTPGLGSGSGTITWTTPTSVNPATTPYFYIYVPVHSNSCPLEGWTINTILVTVTQPSPTDSVWPGDANDDYTVNMYDPLAIAVAYGQTGATRTGATSSWTAQYCAPWANYFTTTNVNMKHADCNGDGVVNNSDLAAVTANYGSTHPRGGIVNAKITGVPALYFDLFGIVLSPGANISVPIKFGDVSTQVSNVYGLAASIEVMGAVTLSAAPTVNYSSSWIGTTSNTLNFTKNINSNQVDWAYARIDQTNVSGYGTIATLNFTVPATATAGQKMKFHFNMPQVIDKNGTVVNNYYAADDSAYITVTGIANVASPIQYVEVVPNPSKAHTELQMFVEEATTLQIKITDLLGKTVWLEDKTLSQGNQNISLPSSNIAPGMYMIQVQGEGWQYHQTLKWVKQ